MRINSFRRRYRNKGNSILITHIQNNAREYVIASIIFIIGLLMGIVYLNNNQSQEVTTYITNSISNLKNIDSINKFSIIKNSIQNDFIIVFLMWILGSTVVGFVLVYLIVAFKGFCLGYTISSVVYTLGTCKSIIFIFSSIFLKNLIVIPAILALAVSGMKLYKSIMQDRRKENIKLEILRHTIISALILFVLILASVIDTYFSQAIFKYCLKYL